ncbi:hypothetical protein EVAR_54908_1 [Eumeta japonica]|uniref:Uncharacterized protein n=1 Tax=Eumeta variegata TaxID=151549 RepID=A0A4C1YWP2_EUMVA|nr:hypothetical protein EVAR_54908_1 [Eumeta japonica]
MSVHPPVCHRHSKTPRHILMKFVVINRHSKSIDTTKKCCGYCRGKFELIVNKKTKEGVVVSTPARRGGANEFALYVKENYAAAKGHGRSHAETMKALAPLNNCSLPTLLGEADKYWRTIDKRWGIVRISFPPHKGILMER